MGIPGLARRLEPYATRFTAEHLDGYSAIIDGPALAYHAQKLASISAANLGQLPSYTEINNEAIKWLSTLEELNISVSRILFDGALPETKRDERLIRHESSNRRIKQFRTSYPNETCPVPSYLGAVSHAFLAPALSEALYSSNFSFKTFTVPGEADDYCASHAKQDPKSVIFTGDTDLVLYEYPPETLIVFFSDADISSGLKAYSPWQIQEKMQLKSLVPFAFALRDGHHDTAIDLVANACKIDLDSVKYCEFSKRYITAVDQPDSLASPNTLTPVDVRISEFVHDVLKGSLTPHVYLPLLVEDPNQTAAWNVGQDIRSTAYSIMARQSTVVQEYKRKAQGIAVQEIKVYEREDLLTSFKEAEAQLVGLKSWSRSKNISSTIIWPLYAVSLVLQELKTPPTTSLVLRTLNGDFDGSWSYIHLSARLQAAVYSLRMLKQISTVASANGPEDKDIGNCITSIAKQMEDFPTINAMFTVVGQTKRVLLEHTELNSLVEEVYVSAGVEIPVDHVSNKKKKRQVREADRKKRKAEQRLKSENLRANV